MAEVRVEVAPNKDNLELIEAYKHTAFVVGLVASMVGEAPAQEKKKGWIAWFLGKKLAQSYNELDYLTPFMVNSTVLEPHEVRYCQFIYDQCLMYQRDKKERPYWFGGNYDPALISDKRLLITSIIGRVIKKINKCANSQEIQNYKRRLEAFIDWIIKKDDDNQGEYLQTSSSDQTYVSLRTTLVKIKSAIRNEQQAEIDAEYDQKLAIAMQSLPANLIHFVNQLDIDLWQLIAPTKGLDVFITGSKRFDEIAFEAGRDQRSAVFVLECFISPRMANNVLKIYHSGGDDLGKGYYKKLIFQNNGKVRLEKLIAIRDLLKAEAENKNTCNFFLEQNDKVLNIFADLLSIRNRLLILHFYFEKAKNIANNVGNLSDFFAKETFRALLLQSNRDMNLLQITLFDFLSACDEIYALPGNSHPEQQAWRLRYVHYLPTQYKKFGQDLHENISRALQSIAYAAERGSVADEIKADLTILQENLLGIDMSTDSDALRILDEISEKEKARIQQGQQEEAERLKTNNSHLSQALEQSWMEIEATKVQVTTEHDKVQFLEEQLNAEWQKNQALEQKYRQSEEQYKKIAADYEQLSLLNLNTPVASVAASAASAAQAVEPKPVKTSTDENEITKLKSVIHHFAAVLSLSEKEKTNTLTYKNKYGWLANKYQFTDLSDLNLLILDLVKKADISDHSKKFCLMAQLHNPYIRKVWLYIAKHESLNFSLASKNKKNGEKLQLAYAYLILMEDEGLNVNKTPEEQKGEAIRIKAALEQQGPHSELLGVLKEWMDGKIRAKPEIFFSTQ